MKSGNKLWSTMVDYFLILGAIIGVGFASGKEISVFFFSFGRASLLGLIAFGLLYIYLFLVIQYISNKLSLNSYNEFTKKIFGKLEVLLRIILFINFTITSAGMLAGADYLFLKFLRIGFKLPSLILSIICFVLILRGIDSIRAVSNIIIPIMIAVIVINGLKNITPANINLPIVKQTNLIAISYGLLFGVNNFIAALPMIFETKLKVKGRLFVILTICFIILINILVFASNTFITDMPMLELSANLGPVFYYVYFFTLILALFSTLIICSFNAQKLISQNKSIFVSIFIVLLNLLISNLGYAFIVQYLYVVSGVLSGIMVVVLVIAITISLLPKVSPIKKFKSKYNYLN